MLGLKSIYFFIICISAVINILVSPSLKCHHHLTYLGGNDIFCIGLSVKILVLNKV
jgi:hypothetical protein